MDEVINTKQSLLNYLDDQYANRNITTGQYINSVNVVNNLPDGHDNHWYIQAIRRCNE